jgi:hypothetical protein
MVTTVKVFDVESRDISLPASASKIEHDWTFT